MSYLEEDYRSDYVPRVPANAIEAEISLVGDHPDMGRPYGHPTGFLHGGGDAVANVHPHDAGTGFHADGGGFYGGGGDVANVHHHGASTGFSAGGGGLYGGGGGVANVHHHGASTEFHADGGGLYGGGGDVANVRHDGASTGFNAGGEGFYGGGGDVANVHHHGASTEFHAGGCKDNRGEASADMYSVMSGSATPEIEALAKTKSSVLLQDQIMDLKEEGFPSGLAEEMGKTRALYPVRFWVLDNSGSMMSNDGQSIRGSISVQCTRWAELQETVAYQTKFACILQATTHFRFLNNPGVRCGPQEFSIADKGANAAHEVEEVKNLMHKCQPSGSTPLTHHLVEIGRRIAVMESRMRRKGLEAVVVLATDGLPTSPEGDTSAEINEEFVQALQYLQSLPVWVVIRLCTDERKVVDFYNQLDSVLELPLEVLDDFFNEAKEIYTHNKWLNYALPLHRTREIGYHHRIFDLLDERPLNKDEIKEFCSIMFGADQFAKVPDIHKDWKGFVNIVGTVLKAEERQFNPITRKVGPWIDVKQLQKAFGGKLSLSKLFRR